MNTNDTQQHTKTHKNSMKESVLSRISNEQICPKSRLFFVCRDCSVWVLWGASVLVGALAVTVTIFISMHAGYALYEATHESPLIFFIEVLPYVWLLVFVSMAGLAYYNLRHTKHGYKYQLTHILVSSVAFSVLGGVVLHVAGVGYMIDRSLERVLPMYRSHETIEAGIWQQPSEGRLVGVFVSEQPEATTVIVRDIQGTVWTVETSELRKPDLEMLHSGNKVRVLGIASTSPLSFHGCGVFPWLYDKNISMEDMRNDRREFVERMYEHMDAGDRVLALEREALSNIPHATGSKPLKRPLCAELVAVKRIRF